MATKKWNQGESKKPQSGLALLRRCQVWPPTLSHLHFPICKVGLYTGLDSYGSHNENSPHKACQPSSCRRSCRLQCRLSFRACSNRAAYGMRCGQVTYFGNEVAEMAHVTSKRNTGNQSVTHLSFVSCFSTSETSVG